MLKTERDIPSVVFIQSAPSVAMTEAEQLMAVSLLRSAYNRIGHRPATFGELLDDKELLDQIDVFLKHSGVSANGTLN